MIFASCIQMTSCNSVTMGPTPWGSGAPGRLRPQKQDVFAVGVRRQESQDDGQRHQEIVFGKQDQARTVPSFAVDQNHHTCRFQHNPFETTHLADRENDQESSLFHGRQTIHLVRWHPFRSLRSLQNSNWRTVLVAAQRQGSQDVAAKGKTTPSRKTRVRVGLGFGPGAWGL